MTSNTHFHITNPDPVIRSLSTEWRLLEKDPANLIAMVDCDLGGSDPESLCEIAMRAGLGNATPQDQADTYLYGITRIAVGSENVSPCVQALATRIVLQRVLPGLITVARRRGRVCDGGFHEAFGRVLTEAWSTIVTFPVERRTQKIAVNILRDSESRAFWRADRLQRMDAERHDLYSTEMLRVFEENTDNEEQLYQARQLAEEHLNAQELVVFDEMLNGVPSADTADRLGVTHRAVRYHRTALTNHLRSLARRNLNEFVTTKTLEPAIANPATIGSSTPVAASGSAATL